MRISRIYQSTKLQENTEILLDERNTQYLIHVLRLKAGDAFCIFNGEGGEYDAKIIAQGKRQYSAQILKRSEGIAESPCKITLGQAISRSDHMDLAIQKSVELGVSAIQPLITEHVAMKLDTKRLQQKHQHWQGIIISACEQSGRCHIPMLHPAIALESWLPQCTQDLRLVLHPTAKSNEFKNNIHSLALLVGPEGGLSEKEVALAEHHHFIALSLGPRILRTETAAIAAITITQSEFGDM